MDKHEWIKSRDKQAFPNGNKIYHHKHHKSYPQRLQNKKSGTSSRSPRRHYTLCTPHFPYTFVVLKSSKPWLFATCFSGRDMAFSEEERTIFTFIDNECIISIQSKLYPPRNQMKTKKIRYVLKNNLEKSQIIPNHTLQSLGVFFLNSPRGVSRSRPQVFPCVPEFQVQKNGILRIQDAGLVIRLKYERVKQVHQHVEKICLNNSHTSI